MDNIHPCSYITQIHVHRSPRGIYLFISIYEAHLKSRIFEEGYPIGIDDDDDDDADNDDDDIAAFDDEDEDDDDEHNDVIR